MLLSVSLEKRCPRGAHPADSFGESCAYCQWPMEDEGRECKVCRVVNSVDRTECIHCSALLPRR